MEQQELQLNHYLKILWRGKWLILASTLLAFGGVLSFILFDPATEPQYTAVAIVKVDPVTSVDPVTGASTALPGDPNGLNTQIRLMGSRNVIERALASLQPKTEELTPDARALQVIELQKDIDVRAISSTNLLEVRAKAPSPQVAQARANAVVEAYIKYVKDERTMSIEEALEDIKQQLQGVAAPDSPAVSQLVVLLPNLASELTNIAVSLEKSSDLMGDIRSQKDTEGVELAVNQELPAILRTTNDLKAISTDLEKIRNNLVGVQGQQAQLPGGSFNVEATQLEETAEQLAAISTQLREIRVKVNQLDPMQSFRAGSARAEDALVSLEQAEAELVGVRANVSSTHQRINSIESYLVEVADDLRDLKYRLERPTITDELNKSERVLLRGELLANTLGLQEAATDLGNIRGRSQIEGFSGRDINRISAAEGQIVQAVTEIRLLSTDLDSTADIDSLNDGLTEILNWIGESHSSILTVSGNILRLDSNGSSDQDRNISIVAANEVEDVALTLQVAATRLRSLQTSINDPLLQARFSATAGRLEASQRTVADVAISLGASPQTQTSQSLADGLGAVRERIQGEISVLSEIAGSVQPSVGLPSTVITTDLAIQASVDTTNAIQSLDIANRQLQSLIRANRDPLLGGELNALADRMLVTYATLKDSTDHLEVVANNGTAASYRRLGIVSTRMKSASNFLRTASDIARQDFSGKSGIQVQETTSDFKEKVDIGQAMLNLITNDLLSVQQTETEPVRYGQLSVLSERIRVASEETSNLSYQIERVQGGRGASYLTLQKLRSDLEISLLQPQDTGITLVDSAVVPGLAGGNTSFFSKVRAPLGAAAGLFLGCLAVLIRSQMTQQVISSSQLRDKTGLPTLGVIPKAKISRNSGLPRISDDNSAPFSEALQLIGASLSTPSNNGVSSLLITSAGPAEGKTMLAVNLAQIFAQYGHRVLLVDSNLRKPEVANVLGLPEEKGLVTALVEQGSPMDYVVETEGLSVLPGGPPPPNPVELLSSPAMGFFLDKVKGKYDMVILDGPPAVGFAETKSLAKGVIGAVLLVKAGTDLEAIESSKQELEASGTLVVGTVLNYAPAEECANLKHDKYRPRAALA